MLQSYSIIRFTGWLGVYAIISKVSYTKAVYLKLRLSLYHFKVFCISIVKFQDTDTWCRLFLRKSCTFAYDLGISLVKVWTKVWFCTFLNSLTSVRVFTRIVSDNPWCSLLAICSLRWKYDVTFTYCIPNHSRLEDGSANTTWYTSAISVGPHGMVQPIPVAMT